ncbi:MAG: T9SS type A sorting domain-containing protein [Bacteroidota bacterium]
MTLPPGSMLGSWLPQQDRDNHRRSRRIALTHLTDGMILSSFLSTWDYSPSGRIALFALVTAFLASTALAQVCTGDVLLSSQTQVDAFACSQIEGSLTIKGADITSLSPVAPLISVEGQLQIDSTSLASLRGLGALTSVGGGLFIRNNSVLASIDSLAAVTSVGGNLYVRENPLLTSIDGLEAVPSIGGTLQVQGNAALTSLHGLAAITTVGGTLKIQGNDALTSLDGLGSITSVGGTLKIQDNDMLLSLGGLSAVTSVGRDLWIAISPALTSLDGLDHITSVGSDLYIFLNEALSMCSCGLNGLISGGAFSGITGTLYFSDNDLSGTCNSAQTVLDTPCSSVAGEDDPATIELALTVSPNPLRDRAMVSFSTSEATDVLVAVYDALGRRVGLLADAPYSVGRHELAFEADSLSAGTYLIRATVGAESRSVRITLTR